MQSNRCLNFCFIDVYAQYCLEEGALFLFSGRRYLLMCFGKFYNSIRTFLQIRYNSQTSFRHLSYRGTV